MGNDQEFGLRYLEQEHTVEGDPIYVRWGMVINQISVKAKRTVGELMQAIEMLGLPPTQESAMKLTVKRIIYENANASLDWMAPATVAQDKDGNLKTLYPDQQTTPQPNP